MDNFSAEPANRENCAVMGRRLSVTGLTALLIFSLSSVQAAPPTKPVYLKGEAFVWTSNSTGATTCAGAPNSLVIDHPLANGNPNALILLTHSEGPASAGGFISIGPYNLSYDDTNYCGLNVGGRWVILEKASGTITANDRFNILIVVP